MSQADLSLLQQYAEHGDEQAFAQLVRQYAGLVHAASRRVLHDPALAEDVTQETFYRLMRKPESVTRSLAGWLHRTATQVAIDMLRTRTARAAREAAYARQPAADTDTWAQLSPHIDAALAHLDEPTRDLLVEHFLCGRTQRELAAERGVSPATMSREIASGLERLRAELHRRDVQMPSSVLAALILSRPDEAISQAFAQQLGKLTLGAAMVNAGAAEASAAALKTLVVATIAATVGVAAVVVVGIFLAGAFKQQEPQFMPGVVARMAADAPIQPAAADVAARPSGYLVLPGDDGRMRSDRMAIVQIPSDDDVSRRVQVAYADGRVMVMTVSQVNLRLHEHYGRGLEDLLYDPQRVVVDEDTEW